MPKPPSFSASLDQWADGPAPDGPGDEMWQNGNLNSTKAHYNEGDAIPYRATLEDLQDGYTYTLTIEWDTVDSSAYAIDFLTGYNYSFDSFRHPTEPDVEPTDGISDLSGGSTEFTAALDYSDQLGETNTFGSEFGTTDGISEAEYLAIIGETQYISLFTNDGDTVSDSFTILTDVDGQQVTYSEDLTKASLTIQFVYYDEDGDPDNNTVVVAWGGRIASENDWADDPGETVETASDINGSPYHMRLVAATIDSGSGPVFQSVGNQDRSLSANAVLPEPTADDATIFVDEDDLPSGNGDVVTGDDDPADFPMSSTTGTLAPSAGSTLSFANLHGQIVVDSDDSNVTVNGATLSYYWDDAADILYASTNIDTLTDATGTDIFNISLDPDDYDYTFTLIAAVDHPSGTLGVDDIPEDPNLQINLIYTATDPGGIATGTIAVTIDDDSPLIEIFDDSGGTDTSSTVIEGGTIGDDIDLSEGADGVASMTVTVSGLTNVSQSKAISLTIDGAVDGDSATIYVDDGTDTDTLGVLTVAEDSNGSLTWTFDAALDIDNDGGIAFSFSTNVVDLDGDTATDTHQIIISDSAAKGPPSQTVTVYEEGLASTTQTSDATAARTGESEGSNESAGSETASVAFSFIANTDNFVDIYFGNTSAIAVSDGDGGTLTLTWSVSGTDTLVGSMGGDPVIELTITQESDPLTNVAAASPSADDLTADATVTATLLDDFPHDADASSLDITGVQLVAEESDGDKVVTTVNVTVVDDDPTAVSDTDTIASGVYDPATGNVITGDDADYTLAGSTDSNTTDGSSDTKGADDAEVSKIQFVEMDATTSTATVSTGSSATIDGDYGTLIIHSDGSYNYDREDDSPGGVTDTFIYTLLDGDGDVSTATLAISIADATPSITVAVGSDQSVDEAGLASDTYTSEAAPVQVRDGESEGSNESSDSETATGSIEFDDGDGPATVTISYDTGTGTNTISLDTDDDGASGILVTDLGEFIATVDTTNNEIDYVYNLLDDADHSSGGVTDSFDLHIEDQDGSTASTTLDITIVDDDPTANDDADTVPSGSYAAIMGNVITGLESDEGAVDTDNEADVKGADDADVFGVVAGVNNTAITDDTGVGGGGVSGTYGLLVLNADGGYTYTRYAGSDGGVTDTFSYTLKDEDDDTDVAQLVITIGDSTPDIMAPTASGSTTVDEAGINDVGTSGTLDTEVVSGAITVDDGDGPSTVTITYDSGTGTNTISVDTNDTAMNEQVVGAYGTLFITSISSSAIGYTYILTDNADHTGAATDSFTLKIEDQDGDSATDTLEINILNDEPVVSDADSAVLFNDATQTVTADLNFLTGADAPVTGTLDLAANTPPAGADAIVTTVGTVNNYEYSAGGAILTGQVSDTNGILSSTDVFTLELDVETGSYEFTLLEETLALQTTELGSGTSFGAGPGNAIIVPDADDANLDVVLATGFFPLNLGTDFILADWQNGDYRDDANAHYNAQQVNFSTAGVGVNNNNMNAGEIVRMDFDTDNFGTSASAVFDGPKVSSVTFELFNYTDPDQLQWVIYYENGTVDHGVLDFNSDDDPLITDGDGLDPMIVAVGNTWNITLGTDGFIDYIEIYQTANAGKLTVLDLETLNNFGETELTFDYAVIDDDGDSDTGSIAILTDGSGTLTGDFATSGVIDDVLVSTPGADAFDGATGYDLVSYQYAAGGVTASLANPAGNTGEAAGDTYTNIDGFIGSELNDTLTGDGGDNFFQGLGGSDTITAGLGEDTVSYAWSGAGVSIDLDADSYSGGDADGDNLNGVENVIGSAHNDTLSGDSQDNVLDGGAGDDDLYGDLGADWLIGGAGSDKFIFDTAGIADASDGFDDAVDVFDTIEDYTFGSDEIVLTGLFTVDTTGGSGADEDELSDFVQIVENGGSQFLQVDVDGGADSWVTIAEFGAGVYAVDITFDEDDGGGAVSATETFIA